jgi:hypothetical protein
MARADRKARQRVAQGRGKAAWVQLRERENNGMATDFQ